MPHLRGGLAPLVPSMVIPTLKELGDAQKSLHIFHALVHGWDQNTNVKVRLSAGFLSLKDALQP